jgi:hypothetical protein
VLGIGGDTIGGRFGDDVLDGGMKIGESIGFAVGRGALKGALGPPEPPVGVSGLGGLFGVVGAMVGITGIQVGNLSVGRFASGAGDLELA